MSLAAPTQAPFTVEGSQLRIRFQRFDLEAFALFLRAKRLPERSLAYDRGTGEYAITAPVRLAGLLDRTAAVPSWQPPLPMSDHLFDYQVAVVGRALEARRFAVWLDTGLGKTSVFLEWARQVVAATGGRVLILSPLQVIEQTRVEARRWYGEVGVIEPLRSREELADWCRRPGSGLGISNYEKLVAGDLPELRRCAGLVLDESSILKTGGGTIKWNLIRSARGIEYKLSCTATPAPNDSMEYASQAAFLEKLRSEGEVLWTYFSRDARGSWSVKPHARKAFYRFLSGWSIYVRNPARYGWRDVLADLPDPEIIEERLPLTEEQRRLMLREHIEQGSGLFGLDNMGVRQRSRLQQMARGFLYERGHARQVTSFKPGHVAGIVESEAAATGSVLVWTTFDEEGRILRDLLGRNEASVALLTGSTPAGQRLRDLEAFRSGEVRILITKPQLVGYGLNFQHCRSMVFSGFDDSFERMYQAIRRCYRQGQRERVRVFVPHVPELEGLVLDNVRAKERRFIAEVQEQESAYIEAMREMGVRG